MFALLVELGLAGFVHSVTERALPVLRAIFGSEYAFVVLFGVFVLEGAMLLYFMPSEGIVPGALLVLGGTPAKALPVIVVAVIGATVGQYALFSVAKRGGRERLMTSQWVRVSETTLDRFDGWFERWGWAVVPISNSLVFTRGMFTIPAGFAKMDDRRFVALSAVGTLVFETGLAALALGVLGWLG